MSEHTYTNRLIHETSPYLLQHAHNPVDWYAWGDEALQQAKAENKPILLSVGYSACHWCHVMEHESFENPATAELMNRNFVNIKVDREERPDIDAIYMDAVQALTGRGGWPMTVFLTPEGLPFYGGTYFPPDNRYNGMPSFPQLLEALSDAYRNNPDDIANNVEVIKSQLYSGVKVPVQKGDTLEPDMLEAAATRLNSQFDTRQGGLGGAPKFPQVMALDFALRSAIRSGDKKLLANLRLTLDKMANGGIYDHLGDGFARYSTDAHWLVPHFEKMLYDNSQLSLLYLEAFQATGEDFYRQVAENTLSYVQREMTHPEGGFYSTQDADSEGEEGKFFIWSKKEIEDILGSAAPAFIRYYGVSELGNFEGHNILNVKESLATVAESLHLAEEDLTESLARSRQKLFEVREKRIHPGRDEKILTSWNGLMLKSFAVAGRVLHNASYTQSAVNNAEFVLKYLNKDGRLLRTFKDDNKGKQAKLNGYLEDYAFFADGLLALYEVTFDLRWLDEAVKLADRIIDQFWEPQIQGFYDTSADHEQLVARPRNFMDNAIPSGSSVAVDVLLRLALYTGDPDARYRPVAGAALRNLAATASQHPTAFGRLLSALDFYLATPKEIVIVGEAEAPDTLALLQTVYSRYLPNKVVMLYPPNLPAEVEAQWPLLQGRSSLNGKATAYVCENYACQLPVNSPEELAKQL